MIFEDVHPTMAPICLSGIGFALATWTVVVHYTRQDLVEPSAVILDGGGPAFSCYEYANFTVPFELVEEQEEEEEQEQAVEEWVQPEVIGPHLRLQIIDNDLSGVVIETTYCAIREGGMNDSYTVVLSSEPYYPVAIDIVGDGTQMLSQGCPAGGCSNASYQATSNLMFDGEAGQNDWRIPKTVFMTAVDDAIGEPICGEVFIEHNVLSTDPKYDNITTPGKAIVVIDDDDVQYSGHPLVDAFSDSSALYSYTDLVSGTVLEGNRQYEASIYALDACSGRRKLGGDVFSFSVDQNSSCPHPCPEQVASTVLPVIDHGHGNYSVYFSIDNVSHLQDVTVSVKVLAASDLELPTESDVHGRPPLLSDPQYDLPTCSVRNVASAENGGTATADLNQISYHVTESIDGALTGSSNGWSYNGGASYASPVVAVFAFFEPEYINSITILSGVDRSNHMLTGFALYITNDPVPQTPIQNPSSVWHPVPGIHFANEVAGGAIVGNQITCEGQHRLEFAFNIARATGVMLEVYDTNAGTDNTVLTELMVHTACERIRSPETAYIVSEIYRNRTECVEEVHSLGVSCKDVVIQGYSCQEMITTYAWYNFDCHCTCTGLSVGGSSLTVTGITFLPFEPYPPATVTTAVQRDFSAYPYVVGQQHTNLNLAVAGDRSAFLITVYDAYGNMLNSSNWRYPHPGRGNVRASQNYSGTNETNATLTPTVHVLPQNSSISTCYVDGFLSSWCNSSLVEEPSAVSQIVAIEDGTFLVTYNGEHRCCLLLSVPTR